MKRQFFEEDLKEYPYEEEFRDLIESISGSETRVKPESKVESETFELRYGWQAILYEEDSGLMKNLRKKLTDFQAGSTNYRSKPEYEWELMAPDGETYRRRGLDTSPEEFRDIVERFTA